MRGDQLHAGKNIWVKNIRFKQKFLNCFFIGYILPGCRVLWMKNNGKNYLSVIIARGGSNRV